MANVMFKKGLVANLPATYAEGTFYVTTDERAIYLDVSDSARIRLGDFQEFANIDALKANTNPSTTALYYVTDVNVLAKWNGTEYIQINRDTGMTSVEVVGEGNAVTAAVYSADGRKLTLTKGATYVTASEVEAAIVAKTGDMTGYENVKAYVDAKTEGIATDAALGELQEKVTTAEGEIDELQKDSHTHANADVLGGITAEKVSAWDASEQNAKDYADGLAGNYDAAGAANAVDEKLTAEVNRAKAAEEANAAAAAAALAEAQKKVASFTAGDASVTVGGTSAAPTVAVKLSEDADNVLELTEDGLKVAIPAAAEYTIEKAAESGEYAAIYTLKKDGVQVGAAINIPKDMVVKSGSVVDGNIVLVLNDEANTEIVIPANSLIEYVTSGSQTGDMVVINVSDDHKVTATITDGSITLAKLSTEVQTAIGKAHSHENADVLAGINGDKVAAWDAAEQNAKDYADGLNTAMDNRVKAVEEAKHTHANAEELAKIAEGDVEKWNGAQAAAEATAAAALSGAKTELEGKITAETNRATAAEEKALADAKAYADGLAGNYDVSGSAATAEQNAKDYADSLVLTWGSF